MSSAVLAYTVLKHEKTGVELSNAVNKTFDK